MTIKLKVNDSVIMERGYLGVSKGAIGRIIEIGKNNGIFGTQIKVKFVVGGIVVIHTFNTNNLPIRKM